MKKKDRFAFIFCSVVSIFACFCFGFDSRWQCGWGSMKYCIYQFNQSEIDSLSTWDTTNISILQSPWRHRFWRSSRADPKGKINARWSDWVEDRRRRVLVGWLGDMLFDRTRHETPHKEETPFAFFSFIFINCEMSKQDDEFCPKALFDKEKEKNRYLLVETNEHTHLSTSGQEKKERHSSSLFSVCGENVFCQERRLQHNPLPFPIKRFI